MNSPVNGIDHKSYYTGVIHIHSAYSHDGHDTILEMSSRLQADGIDFCVLTDHFEDFDEVKFKRYIAELAAVNALNQTIFVPAVEVQFHGFHIIILPASNYEEIAEIVHRKVLPGNHLLKFMAHPTKNSFPEVTRFLLEHRLDGIEFWNQQVDGNYFPPARFIRELMSVMPAEIPAIFFGTDIHSLKNRINNLLLIRRECLLTPEHIVDSLQRKEFVNFSRKLPWYVSANSGIVGITAWIDDLERQRKLMPIIVQSIRKFLKFFYNLLPKPAKLAVNDVKNAIRGKL